LDLKAAPEVPMPVDDRTPTEINMAKLREARNPAAKMLAALQLTGKHVYAGTVPAAEVARRRKANRAARKARRA
jgi:hypothetical protein